MYVISVFLISHYHRCIRFIPVEFAEQIIEPLQNSLKLKMQPLGTSLVVG